MNKLDRQREFLIKISAAGAFIALLYLFLNPYYTQHKKNIGQENITKNKIPTYFDYGSISDSIYCNNYFEFKISIPKVMMVSIRNMII